SPITSSTAAGTRSPPSMTRRIETGKASSPCCWGSSRPTRSGTRGIRSHSAGFPRITRSWATSASLPVRSWRRSSTWCSIKSGDSRRLKERPSVGRDSELERQGGSKERFQPVGLPAIALPLGRKLRRLFQDRPEHRVDRRRDIVATARVDHRAVQEGGLGPALAPAEVPPQRRHLVAASAAKLGFEQHLGEQWRQAHRAPQAWRRQTREWHDGQAHPLHDKGCLAEGRTLVAEQLAVGKDVARRQIEDGALRVPEDVEE